MVKKVEKVNKIIAILALLGTAVMILVTVAAAAYCVPVSDDFWFAADTGREDNFFLYILASLRRMLHEYITWQGSYFSEFINPIFNPVNVGGHGMFRIVMVLHAILVYVAILLFVHVIFERMSLEKSWLEPVIMGCMVFTVAEYDTFPEIFFWYTGATVNSLPLAMGLIGLSLMLLARQGTRGDDSKEKKTGGIKLTAACILGFLSAGGSLAVSGTLCYLSLMLILYSYLLRHRFQREKVIMFAVLFTGSVINVAAPGNFARQKVEQSGDGLSVMEGIANTWDAFCGELEWLFTATNYAAVLLLLVVCGIFLATKLQLDRRAWYITGAFALLTPVVTVFPVVLGYGAAWLPNRCMFIFVVALALCFGNFALIIGDLIGRKLADKRVYAALALVLSALIIIAAVPFSPWSYRSVRLAKGLAEGTYRESQKETYEFLDSLPEHEGEEVEADIATYPEYIEYYYSFFLPDTADDRINRAVAWAYGLKSIRSTRQPGN